MTNGLRVDLFIIVKPTGNTLERLINEEVTLSFSKDFTGVKCAVLLDAPYRGLEDSYKMSLDAVGIGASSSSGNTLKGARSHDLLNDL
jgi:hypothetical protein